VEKGLKYAAEAVRKFGIRKILKALSELSWFFLPFLIWIQIYQYLGQSYFVDVLAMAGIVILLLFIAFVSLFCVQLARLDKKLMKYVEHAKTIFTEPLDIESEKKFRQECNMFIIPYLHYPSFITAGTISIFRGFGIFRRVVTRLLQITIHSYVSYSIVVFIIINQPFFNQIWAHIFSSIPYLSQTTVALLPFLRPFFHNRIPSTGLIFLFSLYFTTSIVRRGYATYSGIIWDILYDSFSIFNRILFVVATLSTLPWDIERRSKALKYEPFTFPTSLPLVIQQSVRNIENIECNVTKWSYLVEHEKDIEILKYVISVQKAIPMVIKFFCMRADSSVALKRIRESKPILYLGTIGDRCAIMGRIEYDSYRKIFRGKFFFDNRYIRNEFKSIAEIEIDEQKKLKRQLHPNLIRLLRKLELREENERRN